MRDYLREQLQRELTRKEFLQILGGLLLAVFGFHNLIALLSGTQSPGRRGQAGGGLLGNGRHGFGSKRFGD